MIYPPLHTFRSVFSSGFLQNAWPLKDWTKFQTPLQDVTSCFLFFFCDFFLYNSGLPSRCHSCQWQRGLLARMNAVINRLTPSASPLKPPQNAFSLAAAVHSSPPLRLYAYPTAGVCASACVGVCVHEGVWDSNHLLQFPSVPTCSIETPPDPVIQTKW